LRILAARVNHRFDGIHSRFDRVDAQFTNVGFRFTEQKQDLLDAVRREIFIVTAFMFGTIFGLAAVAAVFYR
jgi:hypothetical protein